MQPLVIVVLHAAVAGLHKTIGRVGSICGLGRRRVRNQVLPTQYPGRRFRFMTAARVLSSTDEAVLNVRLPGAQLCRDSEESPSSS